MRAAADLLVVPWFSSDAPTALAELNEATGREIGRELAPVVQAYEAEKRAQVIDGAEDRQHVAPEARAEREAPPSGDGS